jgi:class 3 adenylate cyclase
MAIFGAPLALANAGEQAVRAALEMIEMIDLFNIDQESAGKAGIRIGIGIASGQVIAGYTGTQQRATYTCVGNTVNLAARLESHTKVAGVPILIDETTRQSLSEIIQVENLGPIPLKGMNQEITIYSVPVRQPA